VTDLIYIFNRMKFRRIYGYKCESDPYVHVGDHHELRGRYTFHVMHENVKQKMNLMVTHEKFFYFSSVRLNNA